MSLFKIEKYRNPKILKSANGEVCTLRIPGVCNGDPATTVWAHSPWEEDGHGMGTKSHDIFGCYACSTCHDYLDGRMQRMAGVDIHYFFTRAMKKSWLKLLQNGVLK